MKGSAGNNADPLLCLPPESIEKELDVEIGNVYGNAPAAAIKNSIIITTL